MHKLTIQTLVLMALIEICTGATRVVRAEQIPGGEMDVHLKIQLLQEKLEKEKARSGSFQRLLALEERRTGELMMEIKRVKTEYGAQLGTANQDLIGHVRSLCEHVSTVELLKNAKEKK